MAKEPEKKPEPVPEPAAVPPKSFRMQISLGFAALILFQMIFLWFVLPGKQAVQSNLGVDPTTGSGGYETPNALPPEIVKKEPMVEKSISDKPFKVKNTKSDSDITETFTVTIHAKIRKKDEKNFDKDYAEEQFSIVDAVTTVLQASSADDKRQIGLTNIKEKIKKAVNGVFGTPYIQEVLTQDPSFEQQ